MVFLRCLSFTLILTISQSIKVLKNKLSSVSDLDGFLHADQLRRSNFATTLVTLDCILYYSPHAPSMLNNSWTPSHKSQIVILLKINIIHTYMWGKYV